jgi:hypothetical protein
MPEMRGRSQDRHSHDALEQALAAVRDSDATAAVPARIEAAVMQAWDAAAARRRRVLTAIWCSAIAASLLLAAAASLRSDASRTPPAPRPGVRESAGTRPAIVADDRVFTETMLDEEPASLQYVQLRLAPSALTMFGFPLPDLADDQPVDVEALVGLDGLPRALRLVTYR